jgi:hypothetical protein
MKKIAMFLVAFAAISLTSRVQAQNFDSVGFAALYTADNIRGGLTFHAMSLGEKVSLRVPVMTGVDNKDSTLYLGLLMDVTLKQWDMCRASIVGGWTASFSEAFTPRKGAWGIGAQLQFRF